MKKIIAAVSAAALLVITGAGYSNRVLSDLRQNLLRLHILANSDSEADQALKLKVRDRLLKEASDIFTDCESLDESKARLGENIERLEAIAEDELRLNGADYPVTVSLKNLNFPTKAYENFTLPAGEYEACQVIIGEGKGQNWWCVMFPPLCFVDAAGNNEMPVSEELKKRLSENEYDLLTNRDDMDVQIKFKIVEIFQHDAKVANGNS